MWLYLLLLALTLAVVWIRRRYSYWKDHGVAYATPQFPTGNLNRKEHMSAAMQKCYKQLKGSGPFGGIFFFVSPVALALDLDFIKTILVKDFQYFHDRSLYYNEKDDPMSAHLVNMEGTKWRNLRAKLTPTFTSGKMKMMFPTIIGVADEFRKLMVTETQKGDAIEIKEILARFTTDVIGTCAFGLECNSLHDPEAEFRQMGRKVFNRGTWRIFVTLLAQQFRSLSRALQIKAIDPELSQFFMGAVKDTVNYRKQNKVDRNDFMNLLINLGSGDGSEALTMDEISAQAFVFFAAGFETSSTVMSYCLFELAQNTDLQEKARQDVLDSIKRHGSMSYEAVQDMHYIDQCINESLRKYSPASQLFRTVTKDYKVPGSGMVLKRGTSLIVPIHAIHHDPEYYPNPDRYDPNRFSPAEVAKRNPYSFLPFGEGPRNCIGLRFGKMQARIGLATLLKDFRFTLSDRTPVPMKISTSNPIYTSEGGLWLHMEKL